MVCYSRLKTRKTSAARPKCFLEAPSFEKLSANKLGNTCWLRRAGTLWPNGTGTSTKRRPEGGRVDLPRGSRGVNQLAAQVLDAMADSLLWDSNCESFPSKKIRHHSSSMTRANSWSV